VRTSANSEWSRFANARPSNPRKNARVEYLPMFVRAAGTEFLSLLRLRVLVVYVKRVTHSIDLREGEARPPRQRQGLQARKCERNGVDVHDE